MIDKNGKTIKNGDKVIVKGRAIDGKEYKFGLKMIKGRLVSLQDKEDYTDYLKPSELEIVEL